MQQSASGTLIVVERTVISVNSAQAVPIDIQGRRILTAHGKRPAGQRVAVHALGLDGDEQADPTVHGGLRKAVYAYPSEHYPFWRTVRAQAGAGGWDDTLPHGLMGENLTLAGLLESQVWVGDRIRLPDCVLVVTEPRQPCYKFNAVMGFKHASRMMAQSGWCGFYLSVLTSGTLGAGDAYTVDPGPREVSIPELFALKMRRRPVD